MQSNWIFTQRRTGATVTGYRREAAAVNACKFRFPAAKGPGNCGSIIQRARAELMGKIVFSSDQLSAGLDDDQRFSLWCDLHSAQYGLLDFARAEDRGFSAHMECAQFGPVAAGWV